MTNKSIGLTNICSTLQVAYPWIIVSCGMLFYCFNYFLRVSPSTMQHELCHAFHITATQFGTLAALYYFAYTPMQVPAGMLYDKFGVRFVLCLACLLAVSGLSLFISYDYYAVATMGRFLIGMGGAFAYIGTLKLASIWLPPNRFATVAGLTTAVGMVSGVFSEKYLTIFVERVGYKAALHSALFAGLILSFMTMLLVRNRPDTALCNTLSLKPATMREPMNFKQLLLALRTILKNPQTWLIGIIGCLLYLPSSVFLDLWGIPYLRVVHQLTPTQTVTIASYIFYGWILSGPIIGIVSDKIKRRRLPLMIASMIATSTLCFIFYSPTPLSHHNLELLFFIVGFCCGAQALCFALGKENNPIIFSGTAIAITNMLIMVGGMIFQPLVGTLLDLHTHHAIGADGLPIYTAGDYTFALSIIPIGVMASLFLSLLLKETYCTSTVSQEDSVVQADKLATSAMKSFSR